MSTYRTGIPNLDCLTDSLDSPLAPRVLGVANEVQLAAFRSPGTWYKHLETQAAAMADAADAELEHILTALGRLRMALAALDRTSVAVTSVEAEVLAALGALEGFLSLRRVEEVKAAAGSPDGVVHEVAQTEPSRTVPVGNIIRVLRPGATRDGKVIRRALVITSSGHSAQ